MSAARAPRVGMVVQRYGEAIVGGAEAHARMVAHRLAEHVDLTILTSCATDAQTWANDLPAGDDRDGPIRVRRFRTRIPRVRPAQVNLDRLIRWRVPLIPRLGPLYTRVQGPWMPELVDALTPGAFDRLIFVSYLYYPTVEGLPAAVERGIPVDFIPTAHDEPPLRFHTMQRLFGQADRVACNTEAERDLIARLCGDAGNLHVVGCGTDRPDTLPDAPDDPRCHIDAPYVLYLGRDKQGVEHLAPAWRQLGPDAPPLVVAGSAQVDGARNLGRVSINDKWYLLKRARAVVQPSRFESLGLTLIEAWQCGVPVLANRSCEVLKRQVDVSGGGLLFDNNPASLATAVRALDSADRDALAERGARYAERYAWDAITRFYLDGLA